MALQLFYCSWEDCSSLELLVSENNQFYSKTCLSVLTNLDFNYRCGKFLLVWQICQWCWRCPTFLFCCSYCGKFNVIFSSLYFILYQLFHCRFVWLVLGLWLRYFSLSMKWLSIPSSSVFVSNNFKKIKFFHHIRT